MLGLRGRRRSREQRAHGVVIALLIGVFAACAGPTPSTSPGATGYADTLRIGLISPGPKFIMERTSEGELIDLPATEEGVGPAAFPLSNGIVKGVDSESELVGRFLFRALYSLDEHLLPVPDIAGDYCGVDDSRTVYECPLRPARFSNGDPLTAEDVVFTYDLARSRLNPFDANTYAFDTGENALAGMLIDVEAVNPETVRFTLAAPDPGFVTTVLPDIWIIPKGYIERQYEAFRSTAGPISPDKLTAEAELLEADLAEPSADCVAAMEDGRASLEAAGVELPDEAIFSYGPDESFQSCIYARRVVATDLRVAASSLSRQGPDAIAAAYPLLPHRLHPVGAGSWALDEKASDLGRRLLLVASPSAASAPATRRIDFQIFPSRRAAVQAFAAGRLDWLPVPSKDDESQGGATIYRELKDLQNVEFAEHGEGAVEGLYFNVRPGRLFSDVKLRRALEMCIDKAAIVDAATDGQGARADGTISDGLWAANPDLTKVERDTNAAKSLIEESGWRLDANGIYAMGGRSLSADLWAGEFELERRRFAELVALQARECGFDLTVRTADGFVPKVVIWPHDAPDGNPIDAWLMGSLDESVAAEPSGEESKYDSHFATSEQAPENFNFSGFANSEVDQLLADARTTDLAEQADFYHREQAILAREVPIIPGWQRLVRAALRSGVTSLDGPLDLRAPRWSSRLDRIVVPATD
jgi:ABC-type transport system substrate-binding protein